jgi:hypothetical protein
VGLGAAAFELVAVSPQPDVTTATAARIERVAASVSFFIYSR